MRRYLINSSLADSSSQFGLDLLHDAAKSSLVIPCKNNKQKKKKHNGSLLQAVGELAVGQTQFTGSSIDTGDPQTTEVALFVAAITVGVLARLHHRLLGNTVDVLSAATETLGEGQYFLVTSASGHTTFDARQIGSPSPSVDQWPAKGSICAM